MAPLETTFHQLWSSRHGYTWILYPFLAGLTGSRHLSTAAQWVTLGRSLRAVHANYTCSGTCAAHVQREVYAPQWRDQVMAFDQQVAAGRLRFILTIK